MTVDFFLPTNVADPSVMRLLLINDGQDMEKLGLASLLQELYAAEAISPVLCAAIHADADRRQDYGVAGHPDYLQRGSKAGRYTSFILHELLPYISSQYALAGFREKAFAGFSLGALSALDIVWNHPDQFNTAGIFSGALWWRSVDQTEPGYNDDQHRIMHQVIRSSAYRPGMRFFFQCGNMDETMDRNNNGVIDSIDDTLDLIKELEAKGYSREQDIRYLELPDGRHDVATWSRAMPGFLRWAYGHSI